MIQHCLFIFSDINITTTINNITTTICIQNGDGWKGGRQKKNIIVGLCKYKGSGRGLVVRVLDSGL